VAEEGGIIEGVLGGEDAEGPDADSLAGLDPMAAALAVHGMKTGEPLHPRLASYLEKQEKLVEIQTEHLHEQRALMLKTLNWRLHGARLKGVLQVLTTAVGLGVAFWLGLVVWQAAHAHGLVVEAFSTPPDLARNGLTGHVVAEEIEDRINALQAKTDSSRAADTFANDWGRDVKVEIPETGMSLEEVQRLLREWLGHETRISGTVVRTADGVRISVRLEGEPADEASGPETDMDGVLNRVAEMVFARTQPYRYGVYLVQNDRVEDARAAFEHLADYGPPQERGWALTGLASQAVLYPDAATLETAARRAVAAAPELALARLNLADTAYMLGHSEAALEQSKATLRALAQPDHGGVSDRVKDAMAAESAETADELGENPGDALIQVDRLAASSSYFGSQLQAQMLRPCGSAALHDTNAARAQAAQAGPDDAAVVAQSVRFEVLYRPHACVALADGDWREAVRQLSGIDAALTSQQRARFASATQLWPLLARALARSGDVARAEALIGQTPLDCYPCLIARGQVASAKGDARSAERWFAIAARQGPSLPAAYEAWGEARLARGDLSGAEAAFQDAVRRGPGWADPMKGLGDVKAGRGDWREAVEDYDKALRLAPAWAELKRARASAAKRLQ